MGSSLPSLMLERCALTIEKVIIPHLTDDFASMQAGFIAKLLHALAPTVEEKSKELMKENEGMREVLGRVLEVLRREKALSSNIVSTGLIEALDLELQKVGTKDPDISEENHRLKGALAETINGLDALRDDLPKETMSSLRRHIRSVIRQQLDHALARVAGFRIKEIVIKK